MKPLMIRHLEGENAGRFPVWMMRQAGRYLESYREIRKKHSFWEMVSKPEIAAEVSLLPVNELPVDAVIFFSDILTLPYGLGLPIELVESVGPVIQSPLKGAKSFEVFSSFSAEKHTPFVGQALSQIREKLNPEKALIGFAGAPWTVAWYLIEGEPSKRASAIKTWLKEDEAGFTKALTLLARATTNYLRFQLNSGAQMFQLFDTWIGEMPEAFFPTYTKILNSIFDELTDVPRVYFTKNSPFLPQYTTLNCTVLSVDSSVTLSKAEALTEKKFSMQGNLNPELLLGDPDTLKKETQALVAQALKLSKPAIMNLGHGILKNTPVANAEIFLKEASKPWS